VKDVVFHLASAKPLDPRIRRLLKPSVDTLLACRIGFRQPLITMNYGAVSYIENGFSKIDWDYGNRLRAHSTKQSVQVTASL
jgi:hypothetical protein